MNSIYKVLIAHVDLDLFRLVRVQSSGFRAKVTRGSEGGVVGPPGEGQTVVQGPVRVRQQREQLRHRLKHVVHHREQEVTRQQPGQAEHAVAHRERHVHALVLVFSGLAQHEEHKQPDLSVQRKRHHFVQDHHKTLWKSHKCSYHI